MSGFSCSRTPRSQAAVLKCLLYRPFLKGLLHWVLPQGCASVYRLLWRQRRRSRLAPTSPCQESGLLFSPTASCKNMKTESQFIFHKTFNFVDIGRQYCFGGVCEIHTHTHIYPSHPHRYMYMPVSGCLHKKIKEQPWVSPSTSRQHLSLLSFATAYTKLVGPQVLRISFPSACHCPFLCGSALGSQTGASPTEAPHLH